MQRKKATVKDFTDRGIRIYGEHRYHDPRNPQEDHTYFYIGVNDVTAEDIAYWKQFKNFYTVRLSYDTNSGVQYIGGIRPEPNLIDAWMVNLYPRCLKMNKEATV